MESAIYASKIRPASVYAARPAAPPSLSERLESLSGGVEGGEAPPRPATDRGRQHDDRGEAGRVQQDDWPRHDELPFDDPLAQQLAQSLRQQFM